MNDHGLIHEYIEPNPHRPGVDEARLRGYGVAVWALIGYWLGVDGDADRVARDYDVPLSAVKAAVEYYRQYKSQIDARIEANVTAFAS